MRARRSWRKLHLGVDANGGMIVASTLTEQDKGDPSQVGPLLDQIAAKIEKMTADGAYGGAPTYQLVEPRSKDVTVVIPPPVTAVLSDDDEQDPSQRDRHVILLTANGRLGWQKKTCYGRRSLAETAMGRYKTIIGPRLRARCLSAQCTEAAIGVAVLNRMLEAGRPKSVRSMGKST